MGIEVPPSGGPKGVASAAVMPTASDTAVSPDGSVVAEEPGATRAHERRATGIPAARELSRLLSRYGEWLLVLALTSAGAFVRLWHLTILPYGFHSDEGNVVLDAQNILDHGWVGAYSGRAHGYPIAVNYFVAPFLKVFGADIFGVRFPIAVLGIACIPLVYLVARNTAGWRVALCSTVILMFSVWHLHLSRVGFPVMGWAFIELASLLTLQLALKRRTWPWFAATGLLVGVGAWVYNSTFIYAVAVAVFLVVWFVVRNATPVWAAFGSWRRGPRALPRATAREFVLLLILLFSTLFAAWPIISYARAHRVEYQGHFKEVYIFNRAPHQNEDLVQKLETAEHSTKRLFWSVTSVARPDTVDGSGSTPPIGQITMYLALAGAAIALFRLGKPAYGIGLLAVPLMFVSAALTLDGQYRRMFGVLPFIAIFAGTALGTVWEWADQRPMALRAAGVALVVVILGQLSYHNLSYYFRDYTHTTTARFVFFPEVKEASDYLDAHGHPYVYMYSDRANLSHEARQVLAPHIAGGEERSSQFAVAGDAGRFDLKPSAEPHYPATRQPDGAVFLFMGQYVNEAHQVQERYPGGTMSEVDTPEFGVIDYRAYYLPANLLDSYARQEGVTYPVAPK